MKARVIFALAVALGLTLTIAAAASAHDFNPPEGGAGDTPFNSAQGLENGSPHYDNAIANSNGKAANALFRNPTCGAHDTHPPGNP